MGTSKLPRLLPWPPIAQCSELLPLISSESLALNTPILFVDVAHFVVGLRHPGAFLLGHAWFGLPCRSDHFPGATIRTQARLSMSGIFGDARVVGTPVISKCTCNEPARNKVGGKKEEEEKNRVPKTWCHVFGALPYPKKKRPHCHSPVTILGPSEELRRLTGKGPSPGAPKAPLRPKAGD